MTVSRKLHPSMWLENEWSVRGARKLVMNDHGDLIKKKNVP